MPRENAEILAKPNTSSTDTSIRGRRGVTRRRVEPIFIVPSIIIVKQLRNLRRIAAGRTIRVSAEFQLSKLHAKRIVQRQSPDERIADSHYQLNRFGRHHYTNHAREHAQDTRLASARHHAGRRRRRVQAAIAGTVIRFEHRYLPLKLGNAAVHHRLSSQYRGVVDKVTRREVVASVND